MQVERIVFLQQCLETVSGKRVSNTLVTCLQDGHNIAKAMLIPDSLFGEIPKE
jgi:hypothetical protein